MFQQYISEYHLVMSCITWLELDMCTEYPALEKPCSIEPSISQNVVIYDNDDLRKY